MARKTMLQLAFQQVRNARENVKYAVDSTTSFSEQNDCKEIYDGLGRLAQRLYNLSEEQVARLGGQGVGV